MRIEESILSNLLYSEEFCRKALPFLKPEYFSIRHESVMLDTISKFVANYNEPPSKEALKIEITNRTDISNDEHESAIELIESFENRNTQKDWLLDETEKFCKKRAVYNSIMAAIQIIDGRDKDHKEDAIPKLLQDALSVSFDVSVGHSYFDDAEARFDFYNSEEEKIPYDLNIFNKIWGGMVKKSLIVVVAQSGGGKSLVMSHISAATLLQGKNVLYISLEMGENKIGERIDANLLKVDIQSICELGKEKFLTRIDALRSKTMGRLFVKEYPPSSASAANFKSLIEELKVKQNFTPDLIVVDYLGICASSRMKMGGSVNGYTYLKSVAEELRGLGVEYNVPVLTGAQLNREGFNNSEVSETSLAESMGIYMTCDIMYAISRNEQLDELNQLAVKQLKNRYGDLNYFRRFVVGVDRAKMTLYDLEEFAQSGITQNPTQDRQPPRQPNRVPNGFESLNF